MMSIKTIKMIEMTTIHLERDKNRNITMILEAPLIHWVITPKKHYNLGIEKLEHNMNTTEILLPNNIKRRGHIMDTLHDTKSRKILNMISPCPLFLLGHN